MKKYLLMLGLAAATAFGSVSAQTAQATLSISTSNAGYFVENTPITLETSGGSGSGALSWSVANGYCDIICNCWLTPSANLIRNLPQPGSLCELVGL